MGVSVIISNLNGARFLPRLLKSLETQRGAEIEVIVVDRHSTDDSLRILSEHPTVLVVSEPRQTGLVSGYHRGYLASTKEHLFFINEDIWLDVDCIARLSNKIDLSRRVGAADPWQWSYDQTKWIHGVTRLAPVRWSINGAHPFRAYDYTAHDDRSEFVPFACAGACLIHREVYEEAGGWDTSIFLDNEDVEFFLRIWQRDWLCTTVSDAKVYHAVGMSNPGASVVGGKPRISRARYIAGRYGNILIAWKLFSVPNAIWMGFATWAINVMNNICKLRWRLATWDFVALWQCLRRLPVIMNFRVKNRHFSRQHPGERFFLVPSFQSKVVKAKS